MVRLPKGLSALAHRVLTIGERAEFALVNEHLKPILALSDFRSKRPR